MTRKMLSFASEHLIYVKPEVQVVEMNNECAILTGSQVEGDEVLGGATMQNFGKWSVWGD